MTHCEILAGFYILCIAGMLLAVVTMQLSAKNLIAKNEKLCFQWFRRASHVAAASALAYAVWFVWITQLEPWPPLWILAIAVVANFGVTALSAYFRYRSDPSFQRLGFWSRSF